MRLAWALMVLLLLAGPAWAAKEAKEEKDKVGAAGAVTTTAPPTPTVLLPNNERVFSSAEVAILTDLDAKKVELERRTQALELRERLADLMERRLAEKTKELDALKAQIEQLMSGLSGKDNKDLMQLAQMYGAMKPSAAAAVLDKLDNRIVHDVLLRMPVKKSGKIMEALDPIKARIVSEMMAQQRLAGDVPPTTPAAK
jgi:flagellar motility protein MotE (MotC chaperone)